MSCPFKTVVLELIYMTYKTYKNLAFRYFRYLDIKYMKPLTKIVIHCVIVLFPFWTPGILLNTPSCP